MRRRSPTRFSSSPSTASNAEASREVANAAAASGGSLGERILSDQHAERNAFDVRRHLRGLFKAWLSLPDYDRQLTIGKALDAHADYVVRAGNHLELVPMTPQYVFDAHYSNSNTVQLDGHALANFGDDLSDSHHDVAIVGYVNQQHSRNLRQPGARFLKRDVRLRVRVWFGLIVCEPLPRRGRE